MINWTLPALWPFSRLLGQTLASFPVRRRTLSRLFVSHVGFALGSSCRRRFRDKMADDYESRARLERQKGSVAARPT
jgi:hypothetical protein